MHDVGVSHCLHDLHLTQDPLLIVLVLNCALVNDLHSDLLIGRQVDGLLHLTECSFPQGLAQLVLADGLWEGIVALLGLGDSDLVGELSVRLHIKRMIK